VRLEAPLARRILSKSASTSTLVVTPTCALGGPIRNIPRRGRSASSDGSTPTNSREAARTRDAFASSVATSTSTSFVARTSP